MAPNRLKGNNYSVFVGKIDLFTWSYNPYQQRKWFFPHGDDNKYLKLHYLLQMNRKYLSWLVYSYVRLFFVVAEVRHKQSKMLTFTTNFLHYERIWLSLENFSTDAISCIEMRPLFACLNFAPFLSETQISQIEIYLWHILVIAKLGVDRVCFQKTLLNVF